MTTRSERWSKLLALAAWQLQIEAQLRAQAEAGLLEAVELHTDLVQQVDDLKAQVEGLQGELRKVRGELFHADVALIAVQENLMREVEPQRVRLN